MGDWWSDEHVQRVDQRIIFMMSMSPSFSGKKQAKDLGAWAERC